MILCRRPLILWIDAGGLLAVCACLAALVMLVILPLNRSRGELPRMQDELSTTNHQRRAFGRRNDELNEELNQRLETVRAQAPKGLIDAGVFLERISAECAHQKIELLQLEPQLGAESGAYKSWKVRVRAKGAFPAFVGLLAEIESWSPYVHVPELEITGPHDATQAACDFVWTIQVNLLDNAAAPARGGPT